MDDAPRTRFGMSHMATGLLVIAIALVFAVPLYKHHETVVAFESRIAATGIDQYQQHLPDSPDFQKALFALQQGRFAIADVYLRPLADKGNDVAQFLSAQALLQYDPRQKAIAWALVRQSAHQGNPYALLALANNNQCFDDISVFPPMNGKICNGYNPSELTDKVVPTLKRMADNGDPQAAYYYAISYAAQNDRYTGPSGRYHLNHTDEVNLKKAIDAGSINAFTRWVSDFLWITDDNAYMHFGPYRAEQFDFTHEYNMDDFILRATKLEAMGEPEATTYLNLARVVSTRHQNLREAILRSQEVEEHYGTFLGWSLAGAYLRLFNQSGNDPRFLAKAYMYAYATTLWGEKPSGDRFKSDPERDAILELAEDKDTPLTAEQITSLQAQAKAHIADLLKAARTPHKVDFASISLRI